VTKYLNCATEDGKFGLKMDILDYIEPISMIKE